MDASKPVFWGRTYYHNQALYMVQLEKRSDGVARVRLLCNGEEINIGWYTEAQDPRDGIKTIRMVRWNDSEEPQSVFDVAVKQLLEHIAHKPEAERAIVPDAYLPGQTL